jgi:hypothetical protein
MNVLPPLRGKEALLARRLFPAELAPLPRVGAVQIDTNTLRDVFEIQSRRALALLDQFNLPQPKGSP